MVAAIPQDNAHPMRRSAKNTANLVTSEQYGSERVRAMNEVEQEAAQESAEENCIDSVHINSNLLIKPNP